MSYCRFGWNGSDVYVYESERGLTCCGCRLVDGGFDCATTVEMIAHLAAHRAAGQFVPAHAIESLWAESPGAQRPSRPEPLGLTFSRLLGDIACLEVELIRAFERMTPDQRTAHPLPAGLRRRYLKAKKLASLKPRRRSPRA